MYVKQEIRILGKLMKTSAVLPTRVDDSFLKTLTEVKNTASVIGYCPNKFISTHTSGNNKNKRCYVGKEMINVVFTPPGTVQLAKVYQKLLTSGLVKRWEQGAIWLMA